MKKIVVLLCVLLSGVSVRAQTLKTAREYYQELLKAGAFHKTIPTADRSSMVLQEDQYVCFADAVPDFFTFTAEYYDKAYVTAEDVILMDGSTDAEKRSALDTIDRMRAEEPPYVQFTRDLPPDKYLKDRFELQVGQLRATFYSRGVHKTGQYERMTFNRFAVPFPGESSRAFDANTWELGEWDFKNPASLFIRLVIEPKTFRYILDQAFFDPFPGKIVNLSAGICEAIPATPPIN